MALSFYDLKIQTIADYVREQLQGGNVFGVPIDMNNPDHVIVAAYFYGIRNGFITVKSTLELEKDHNNG